MLSLVMQALVGQQKSPSLHVFELTRQIPRFGMYAPWPLATSDEGRNWVKIREPKGSVKFKVSERINRVRSQSIHFSSIISDSDGLVNCNYSFQIAMWMNQNFLLSG